jgi:hypothetical protein
MSKSVKPLAQPVGVFGPSGVVESGSSEHPTKANMVSATTPHNKIFFIVKLLLINFASHTGNLIYTIITLYLYYIVISI